MIEPVFEKGYPSYDAVNRVESEYQIVDVDYVEKDAILKIEDWRVYFQFDGNEQPTIVDCIKYLVKEAEKQYDTKQKRLDRRRLG